MELEKVRSMAKLQDTNTYMVTMDTFDDEIELRFEMQVDMPYQYWIDIHQFYIGHEQSLKEFGGDVIKRVIKFYGQRIIDYLADGKFWSEKGINLMLEDYEGLVSDPFIIVKVTDFNFEYDIATDYRIK